MLVPITENLALFLKDVAHRNGPVWPNSEPFLFDLMRDAGKDSGVKWKHNALRHSFISYRVAKIKNVNEVAMEAGNSPDMIFKHYFELVTEKEADAWFGVTPGAVAALKKKQEAERAAGLGLPCRGNLGLLGGGLGFAPLLIRTAQEP